MTEIVIIDCETTGTEDDARAVEIGALWFDYETGSPLHGELRSTLVNPGIPIPATASAVHHITDGMCADAPAIDHVMDRFRRDAVYVAHNAKFDRRFLGALGDRWVCTYKCALQQWPDAPSHGNQVLSYWLNLTRPPEGHAHRAMYDVWTTAFLLVALRDAGWTLDRMLDVSSKPSLLAKFRFGKHANVPLAQVPADYLQWMLRQDFDEDVMFTARTELERRRGA